MDAVGSKRAVLLGFSAGMIRHAVNAQHNGFAIEHELASSDFRAASTIRLVQL
jgi:hypothetical protein